MTRAKIILIAVGVVIAALVAESYLGSKRYLLNGVTYAVPHKYEFLRNFSVPWLVGMRGLDKEPDESVWLLFPAKELTQGVPNYKQWFHGYASQVESEVVVNVLGGKKARDFPDDRRGDMAKVAQELAKGSLRQVDRTTGWDRVYWLVGEKGTPGEGGSLFYLIPHGGLERLPSDWRVPYCHGSPDMEGREIYDCSFTIYRSGLTFGFSLRQENIGTASHIPDYVQARMKRWRA